MIRSTERKHRNTYRVCTRQETGASMVEFIVVAPILLFFCMGTIQAGLLYHANSTLNYATFEAARAGAVNHAQLDPMRKELGMRLAPLVGGDGTAEKAALAILKSSTLVANPANTRLRIINPTREAFDDWGEPSDTAGVLVIPNSHLRHKDRGHIGASSGLNLHDANLLKIEVTHGVDMKVPVFKQFLSRAMQLIDPVNSSFYVRGRFPLRSVATVRMQSETWDTEAILAAGTVPQPVETTPTGMDSVASVDATLPDVAGDDENGLQNAGCGNSFGLTGELSLMSSAAYASGACTVGDHAFSEALMDSATAEVQSPTFQEGECSPGSS